MARMVQCVRLGREAEGLDFPPYPGELGKRVWQSVSKEGWQQWLQHQTRLINEYRLSGSDERSREMLRQEMEQFLFGNGEVKEPEQYRPE
jgi:Fe-S cluster biosynthesis and repair protein YggX